MLIFVLRAIVGVGLGMLLMVGSLMFWSLPMNIPWVLAAGIGGAIVLGASALWARR